MRVSLETSGGFTGLRSVAAVDTAEVPGADAAALERALAQLPGSIPAAPKSPEPRYTLSFVHGTTPQRVVLTPSQVPGPLRPLISELLHRARPAKPGTGG